MGIATSMAIGLGIAGAAQAGASIYAGKQQSKAAKQAANTQAQHADRAMGAVESALGPWVNKCRETASTLGRLTSAPAGSRFAAPDPTMPRPGGVGYQQPHTGQRPNPQQAPPRRGLGGSIDRMQAIQGGADPRQVMAQRQGTIGGMGPGGPGGGPQMIPMRAPDGSVQPVPAHLVDRFIAKGAQIAG